jgi:hypothetical protein
MTQSDPRPPVVAPGDTAAVRPAPAVNLMGEGVRPVRFGSAGLSSVRQWILGAGLVLGVALLATMGILLARGGGSSATTAGSTSGDARAQVSSHSPVVANPSSDHHRRNPIRRTSARPS